MHDVTCQKPVLPFGMRHTGRSRVAPGGWRPIFRRFALGDPPAQRYSRQERSCPGRKYLQRTHRRLAWRHWSDDL